MLIFKGTNEINLVCSFELQVERLCNSIAPIILNLTGRACQVKYPFLPWLNPKPNPLGLTTLIPCPCWVRSWQCNVMQGSHIEFHPPQTFGRTDFCSKKEKKKICGHVCGNSVTGEVRNTSN